MVNSPKSATMTNPKFEFEMIPLVSHDVKTGLYSAKFSIFKNVSGIGRTQKEAEENLYCSLSAIWKNEKEHVINVLMNSFFKSDQKPQHIDLVTA